MKNSEETFSITPKSISALQCFLNVLFCVFPYKMTMNADDKQLH